MELMTLLAIAYLVAVAVTLGGAFALAGYVVRARRRYYTTRVPH